MSSEALNWAKRAKTGSVCKKAILMVLADYADHEWSCFPSQATIAAQAEVGERTVRRVLAEWEEQGVIRRCHRKAVDGRGRSSDRIYLQPASLATWSADQPATGDDQPATGARPTGQAVAREPLEEPPVENLPLTLLSESTDITDQPPSKETMELEFTEWYQTYPRRKKPADARRAYVKARKIATKEQLLTGAEMVARLVRNQKQSLDYTPYPATWLNAESWADEVEPDPSPFSPPPMRYG